VEPLFTTAGLHPRNSFQRWRETLSERLLPIEQERLDDSPFEGQLDLAQIGSLEITRTTQRSVRSEITRGALRRCRANGRLVVLFKLAGVSTSMQDDRSSVQRPGDLSVLDQRPAVLTSSVNSQSMFLDLPRERLESVLGPSRLYTALTVEAGFGSTTLARTFFHDLIRLRRQLAPEAVERMAGIGVDLIVASLAERMAQNLPRSLHGNVTLQRAKAYVEAHLSAPDLDPPHLAAAVGVSLRRLQELFHERGQHISNYIWHRRLETAAERLADPGCAHLPLGTLAYGCGFANQAHFSRRFKERFGMSPRAYRHEALLAPAC
jgi:AraC family transcriptional regulator, positive regulator of tynA and feaB